MDTRSYGSTKHMMIWFLLGMLFFFMLVESDAKLSENFYASTCPNVELIVQQAVTTKYQQTTITAPATLRMFFHDCFVGVCIGLFVFLKFSCVFFLSIFGVIKVVMTFVGDYIGM